MAVRFAESQVPAKGRITQGVKGMKLRDDDHVVAFEHVTQGDTFQIVTVRATGKRIGPSRSSAAPWRGGYRVKAITLKPGDQVVAARRAQKDTDQIIFQHRQKGTIIRLNANRNQRSTVAAPGASPSSRVDLGGRLGDGHRPSCEPTPSPPRRTRPLA